MKNLNNTQKMIRWASEKRTRTMGHVISELNMVDEKQVIVLLGRLARKGFIKYQIMGKKIKLQLTRPAYYGRRYLVA